jgi:hypothetical protein
VSLAAKRKQSSELAPRVLPLTLGKVIETRIDPNADDVMVIMMSHTGELLIDNTPLISIDAEKKRC